MQDYLTYIVGLVDWRGAAGIVFGAAISATVAYFLQRTSFAEARRQKEADKRDERRSLGLNVLTKMMRIASTIELLKQAMDNAFARANAAGIKSPPWAVVIPIANFPGRVHFEPEELTEIMRLDFDLFNDLGPFDDVHNTLLDLFELYRTDRNAVTGSMAADMNGMLGTTSFTPEQMKTLAPKMAALDTLVAGMVQRTKIDSEEGWVLLKRLQDALNKEFNLRLRLERKPLNQ